MRNAAEEPGSMVGMGVICGPPFVTGVPPAGTGATGAGTTGAGVTGAGALGVEGDGDAGEMPGNGVTGAGETGGAWARTAAAPSVVIATVNQETSDRPFTRTSMVILIEILLHSLFNLTPKLPRKLTSMPVPMGPMSICANVNTCTGRSLSRPLTPH